MKDAKLVVWSGIGKGVEPENDVDQGDIGLKEEGGKPFPSSSHVQVCELEFDKGRQVEGRPRDMRMVMSRVHVDVEGRVDVEEGL